MTNLTPFREQVARWREKAEEASVCGCEYEERRKWKDVARCFSASHTLDACADELAALLDAAEAREAWVASIPCTYHIGGPSIEELERDSKRLDALEAVMGKLDIVTTLDGPIVRLTDNAKTRGGREHYFSTLRDLADKLKEGE